MAYSLGVLLLDVTATGVALAARPLARRLSQSTVALPFAVFASVVVTLGQLERDPASSALIQGALSAVVAGCLAALVFMLMTVIADR